MKDFEDIWEHSNEETFRKNMPDMIHELIILMKSLRTRVEKLEEEIKVIKNEATRNDSKDIKS
jgi:hypothetical protein